MSSACMILDGIFRFQSIGGHLIKRGGGGGECLLYGGLGTWVNLHVRQARLSFRSKFYIAFTFHLHVFEPKTFAVYHQDSCPTLVQTMTCTYHFLHFCVLIWGIVPSGTIATIILEWIAQATLDGFILDQSWKDPKSNRAGATTGFVIQQNDPFKISLNDDVYSNCRIYRVTLLWSSCFEMILNSNWGQLFEVIFSQFISTKVVIKSCRSQRQERFLQSRKALGEHFSPMDNKISLFCACMHISLGVGLTIMLHGFNACKFPPPNTVHGRTDSEGPLDDPLHIKPHPPAEHIWTCSHNICAWNWMIAGHQLFHTNSRTLHDADFKLLHLRA